jgi:hypothetical protein
MTYFNNYFRNCYKTFHSLQEFKVYLTKNIGQKAPHLDTCENFDYLIILNKLILTMF